MIDQEVVENAILGFKGKIKKIIIWVAIFTIILTVGINSCTTVQQRERGVNYTFGKVKGDVIQPGLVFHAPFISKVKCYSIAPKTFNVNFSVGADGAITKDLQTIGTSVSVKYAQDENRIMEIATRYGDSVVESAMKAKIIASVKEVVGGYTIYELIEKQAEITNRVGSIIKERMVEYPIVISTIDITNWNWSDDFDAQIKATANRTQQVKIAQQEAEIAAAQAQKRVKEAEANRQAAELDAQAERIKAEGEAAAKVVRAEGERDAKKAEGDGVAYYNAKVSQNLSTQQQQWKHDEQMAYYSKWNGELVPTYIPLTAAGGVVNLK